MTNALLIKDEGYMLSISFPSRTILLDFLDSDLKYSRSHVDHKVNIYPDQLDSFRSWANERCLEIFEFQSQVA
ncbi:MAG: hypothetical protein ABJG47_04935 [Ekhidna sp.]